MLTTRSIAIVTPVYNDWESLELLLSQIKQLYPPASSGYRFEFFIVNDGSTAPVPESLIRQHEDLTIIHLTRNLGHQRAIAIGLCYVSEHFSGEAVVVMDADGEDRPEQIIPLLKAGESFNGIVFSGRSKRQESFIFRKMYALYKFFFYILTNEKIPFGNFCVIPFRQLRSLVHVPEIWNHFAGGLMRSRIPYSIILQDRGRRLKGKSNMSLSALILHGISSIAIYLDVVAVRAFMLSLGLIGLCFVLFLVMLYHKFFTPYAIKGWATYTTIGLVTIVLQTFFTSLIIGLIVSSTRNQPIFIPVLNYWNFIAAVNNHETAPVAKRKV